MAPSEWTAVPTVDLDATAAPAVDEDDTDTEPTLPWPLWLHTPTVRWLVSLAILLWVPTAIAWYIWLTASPGCELPTCRGGALQCCPGRGFGAPCVGRPDLVGLSCAEWTLADQSCESYFCAYVGNATWGAWLPATVVTFEATFDRGTVFVLLVLVNFATILSLSHLLIIVTICRGSKDNDHVARECALLRSEHERRLVEYRRRRRFLVRAPPCAV
jgi:hypothetical protein